MESVWNKWKPRLYPLYFTVLSWIWKVLEPKDAPYLLTGGLRGVKPIESRSSSVGVRRCFVACGIRGTYPGNLKLSVCASSPAGSPGSVRTAQPRGRPFSHPGSLAGTELSSVP